MLGFYGGGGREGRREPRPVAIVAEESTVAGGRGRKERQEVCIQRIIMALHYYSWCVLVAPIQFIIPLRTESVSSQLRVLLHILGQFCVGSTGG